MNNSLGKAHGVVSVEQPIEGLGPQGVEEIKKRLAFTPKRKSKNWRNGNFGSMTFLRC
jgi:hypothetical protein